jgi:Na+-transporting NADH:ubiquinone oxidoreductase subunit NqrC
MGRKQINSSRHHMSELIDSTANMTQYIIEFIVCNCIVMSVFISSVMVVFARS